MAKTYKVGAELFLRDRMSGPLRGAEGVLGRLKNLGDGAGKQFKSMARDMAKAGVAALAAKKAIDLFVAGVNKAKGLASADIDLRIAVMRTGDDPADIDRRMKALRKTAFAVSKDVTGTQGDVEKMFAAGLKMGFFEDALLGGLGRAGALLAESTGQAKDTSLRQAGKFGAAFGAKGGEMERFANLLAQGADTGKFENAAQFSHEMGRAGPAVAALGGTAEDAAAMLAMVSDIRTEGSGTAIAAALREVTAKGKQGKLHQYGLEGIVDKDSGKIRSLPDVQKVLRDALGGRKKSEQLQAINEVFGAEGALFAQALLGTSNAADVLTDMLGRLTVEERNTEKSKTLEKQMDAMTGTWATGIENAFAPAERWMAGLTKAFNESVVSPTAGKIQGSEGLQGVISGAPVAAGGAAALAALFFGGRAIGKGMKGMKLAGGLKGMLSTDVTALAKAKVLEKTAGVQPVAVVNVSDFKGALGAGVPGVGGGDIPTRDAGKLAKVGAFVTKNRALPGALGSGAAMAGGAAVAGVAALGASAALAGYGMHKTATEAHQAQAVAEAQFKKRGNPKDIIALVTASKKMQGEKHGWSDERVQAEIQRSVAGFQTQGKAGKQYDGFFSNWLGGMKEILGMEKGGAEAAEKQRQAAEKMAAAAEKFPNAIDVKVTIDKDGTRATANMDRRGK